MATSPVFPRSNLTWPIETLRRGVSFVLARASARHSSATLFRLGVMGCTLLTFGLGFLLWDRFPFREDEAIYAYWALHFARIDPWFLTVWPDKPPLFLWSLAGVFELFGPSPASARLLNMAVTALTVPVVALIARRLWGRVAGLWAAATFALNPFVLSFAPTAYTDPMLALWGMIALYAALSRRPFWAGITLGAAIMTKQQGALFVPLIFGVMANGEWRMASEESNTSQSPSRHSPSAIRHLLGLAAVILPIVFWDSRRWAVAPSPWDLAVGNYGGLGLLSADLWISRWRTWGGLFWQMGGSWAIWAGLAAGLIFVKAKGKRQRAKGKSGRATALIPDPRSLIPDTQSPIPNPQSLLLWTLGFIALHLFTTIQPWDRYLLPLAPMLALLAGWMGGSLARINGRRVGAILGLAWILLLLPTGLTAAQGGLPLGGDHGDYAGFDAALAWFQANAPADAVLYHQELGPQYRFYLFGQTQNDAGQRVQEIEHRSDGCDGLKTDFLLKIRQNPFNPSNPCSIFSLSKRVPQIHTDSGYDLRWAPSAVYLADNAAKTPTLGKFMIQPDWAATRDQARYLPMRGMAWLPRFYAGKFTVYEIMTQPGGAP